MPDLTLDKIERRANNVLALIARLRAAEAVCRDAEEIEELHSHAPLAKWLKDTEDALLMPVAAMEVHVAAWRALSKGADDGD